MNNLSRRRFLKIGAGTMAAAGSLETAVRVLAGRQARRAAAFARSRRSATSASGSAAPSPPCATASSGRLKAIRSIPCRVDAFVRAAPAELVRISIRTGLRSPLLRVSERGEDKWKAVTWDEALSFIADKDAEDQGRLWPGVFCSVHPWPGRTFFKHTLRAYGTNNIAAPSFAQCRGPRDVGFTLTFGDDVGVPGANRHRERPMHRPDRVAPRREHAQHAGAGIRHTP